MKSLAKFRRIKCTQTLSLFYKCREPFLKKKKRKKAAQVQQILVQKRREYHKKCKRNK